MNSIDAKRLAEFPENICKLIIILKTRNISSLSPLKDTLEHVSSVIYEGICNCEKNYIGKTERNVIIRWIKCVDEIRTSKISVQLFMWKIL